MGVGDHMDCAVAVRKQIDWGVGVGVGNVGKQFACAVAIATECYITTKISAKVKDLCKSQMCI